MQEAVDATDKLWREMMDVRAWMFIENIVLIIVAGLLANYVSAWCLLILLMANTKFPSTKDGE